VLHLNPQIEAKKTNIAHSQTCLHLELELCNLVDIVPSDDKVVNVHADEEPCLPLSARVHSVLVVTVLEAELLLLHWVELGVPCPRRLMETVQYFVEAEHFAFLPVDDETGRLRDVHLFL
jgi:hypothetical protein